MPGLNTAPGVKETRQTGGATVDEDADGHQGQDGGLGDQEDAEHPGADVDAQPGQHEDQCDGHDRDHRPGHRQPEDVGSVSWACTAKSP